MGCKMDLSGLTELEAEHVLEVVQRDMRLRKTEEQRLSDLRRELAEEDDRRRLLSRQTRFNRRCCICCCSPFNFLLKPRRCCGDCLLNVCPTCCVYRKPDRAWLCSTCQKRRLLKTQSLEWFYVNIKHRFKRFGSAKVLKILYRKHLEDHGALAELSEGSTYEDSVYNEGSVCESDTAFCRQSQEHGMADTLTVATRVAGEAIDESISKAEFHTDNQAKQNEAHYLREHRGELIEELAKTIVQKIIIQRKGLAEMKPGSDQEWLPDYSQGSLTRRAMLRSLSAFSLLDNTSSELTLPPGSNTEGRGSAMPTWKSVDRLDHSMLQSPDGNWIALQSGQLSWPSLLTQRKSLVYSALERESGPVSTNQTMDSEDPETPPEYSGSWGAVLQDLHKKMTTGGGHDLQGLEGDPQTPLHPIGQQASLNGVHSDSEGASKHCRSSQAFMKLPQGVRRPSSSRRTSVISLNFNPEGTAGDESSGREGLKDSGVRRSRGRRKSKKEKGSSSSSLPKSKKNHAPSQHASDSATPLTSEAVTLDPFHQRDVSVMGEELVNKLQQLARRGSLLDVVGDGNGGKEQQEKNGEPGEGRSRCGGDEDVTRSEKTSQEARANSLYQKCEEENQHDKEEEKEEEEEEEAVRGMKMEYNPCRLATQFYSSSLHPELNWACQGEGGWETGGGEREEEEKEVTGRKGQVAEDEEDEDLVFQLLHPERRVRANRLSSIEDKLDQAGRGGTDDGETDGGRARGELLATKLCRLAEQVSTGEFLSTDDDDSDKWESMGRGEAEERWRQGREGLEEGESEEEETLMWTMEAEKAIQASQLRDLASLVSASQFCSTEDELDQEGGGEGGWDAVNRGDTKAGWETEGHWLVMTEWEGASMESEADRRGSEAELNVGMFDFLDGQQRGGIKKAVDDAARALEEQGDAECRCRGEENWLEGTVHPYAAEAGGEHGYLSLGRGCGVEDNDWPWKDQREDLSCAPVQPEESSEDSSKDRRQLQTGQGEDTGRETNRDPTATVNKTRVSKDDVSGHELVVYNREEEQMWLARTWTWAETKCDTSEHGDVETARIMSSMGKQRDKALDDVDGEMDVASKETVEGGLGGHTSQERDGSETVDRRGDGTTLESICGGEGGGSETGGEDMGNGEELIAGGGKEQGGIASGSQAGDFRSEEMDDASQRNGDIKPEDQTSILSPEEIQNRYSAVLLRSLTTEMLKVLNTTEALLQGVGAAKDLGSTHLPLSPDTDPLKLDQQFSRLEENVYVAAGTVFSLESELGGLEECARAVSGHTPDGELTFLEEQVASAAAKVHQSELQILNISARIAALKSAGLNVDSQSLIAKTRMIPTMPNT